MISRDDFDRLSVRDRLLYLYDEIAQIRRAGGVTAAVLEDHRKRLEAIEHKRPDSDA